MMMIMMIMIMSQDDGEYESDLRVTYLCKSGSLGHYADISDTSYVKPRGCKSSNHLNGLNSEVANQCQIMFY